MHWRGAPCAFLARGVIFLHRSPSSKHHPDSARNAFSKSTFAAYEASELRESFCGFAPNLLLLLANATAGQLKRLPTAGDMDNSSRNVRTSDSEVLLFRKLPRCPSVYRLAIRLCHRQEPLVSAAVTEMVRNQSHRGIALVDCKGLETGRLATCAAFHSSRSC